MKKFNTTAVCIPSKHYMVDLKDRVEEIKAMVDDGEYFTINRARQYGKTTTLNALSIILEESYYIVSMDFQDYGEDTFSNPDAFCRDFLNDFCDILIRQNELLYDDLKKMVESVKDLSENTEKPLRLFTMFRELRKIWGVSDKPIVLLIDEVDSATNNQLFLDFLAGLRSHYLKREKNIDYKTFQSVILAGVTDVKHLKSKIRDEDQHKVNSPWNIAADFTIDMSLSEEGISKMLDEYAKDHEIQINTEAIAKQIRDYTNGYPYLVSRICQKIDENMVPKKFSTLTEAWTEYGVDEAVKMILEESDNALFDSLIGKLHNYPELGTDLRNILLCGDVIEWKPDNEPQKQLRMYGFIRNNNNQVAIDNRIFEMRLYRYFIGENRADDNLRQEAALNKSLFIDKDGYLDVQNIMQRFIDAYKQIYGETTERFVEEEGRKRFLTFLTPIINGTGTYSIEEQTRNGRRMDVVIHYRGRRYIIELKIWHGERYNSKGEKQIKDYLDFFGLDTGYLLSFNFNIKKETGVKPVEIDGKLIYEGIV